MSDQEQIIPFNDLALHCALIADDLSTAMQSVIRQADFIRGSALSEFEQAFAALHGRRYAIGVASGTDSLMLAVRSLDIGPGDEVITTPDTWISVAFAISHTGATPVFVDVEPHFRQMDMVALEQAITDRTRAVIVVHNHGHPVDLVALEEICRARDIRIIEDAAQAPMARIAARMTGTTGDLACFSFYPGKNLGAFGDGGMVLTDDPDLAQKIKRLADYGQTERHVHTEIGYNSRLDTLQAAVLLAKLPYLPQWTKNRRRAAKWYDRKLSSLSVTRPATAAGAEPVYHLYAVLVEDRDDCLSWLRDRGVMAQVHYHGLIHLQECYNHLGYKVGNFPVAEKIHKHSLSLPLYPEITE